MLNIKTVYASGNESERTGLLNEADALAEFRHFLHQLGTSGNGTVSFRCELVSDLTEPAHGDFATPVEDPEEKLA